MLFLILKEFVDSKLNAGVGNGIGNTNNSKNSKSYQDRAASRRSKVGSSSDKEKTQTSSVDT